MIRALVVLLFALGGCASTAGRVAHETVVSGAQASDFTLRDLDGKQIHLSDYGGKVVLLDFWATWCVPCAAELPQLEELYQKRSGDGLVVLGIAMDGPESVAQVVPFARRYNLTFPTLLDEETRVVSIYNPKRVAPMTVLIDRRGIIARVRNGYNAGDEKLIADDVANL
ncbi:MAG: TlpA disulfide reductase family protein, partial [Polyangia bacterium]